MLYSNITRGMISRGLEGSAARLIETTHAPYSELGWHEHEDLSLDVVLEGDFREVVRGDEYVRSIGSILIKGSGITHRNAYGRRGTRTLVVHLSPTSPLLEDFGPLFTRVRHWEGCTTLAAVLEATLRSVESADGALAVDEAVIDVLGTLAPPRRRNVSPLHFRRMRARVLECGPTDLTEIARECGMSPSAFTHAFRARFGCSPRSMQRRQRLQRACLMLRMSERPIAIIAAEAGFADQAHLTRECVRVLGLTPKAYRLSRHGRRFKSVQ